VASLPIPGQAGSGDGHLVHVAPWGALVAVVDGVGHGSEAATATRIALEVRVSNFAAQALYRGHGFRLAGLRRGYYRDTGEDALIMEWRAGSGAAVPSTEGGDR